MATQTRVASRPTRCQSVANRLPRPAKPTRPRCEIDEAELRAIEDAAHACRLSVASFIRVALVESAAAAPGRVAAWGEIAERLTAEAPPDQRRPGRPPKEKGKRPKK